MGLDKNRERYKKGFGIPCGTKDLGGERKITR
jgi:hypothetical protein